MVTVAPDAAASTVLLEKRDEGEVLATSSVTVANASAAGWPATDRFRAESAADALSNAKL